MQQPDSKQNQTSLLTTKQLLERIPVCRRTVDNWKDAGVIPYIKIGRQILYDWEHVEISKATACSLVAKAVKEGWLKKDGREYALIGQA